MLKFMGSQRVGDDLAIEQQQGNEKVLVTWEHGTGLNNHSDMEQSEHNRIYVSTH